MRRDRSQDRPRPARPGRRRAGGRIARTICMRPGVDRQHRAACLPASACLVFELVPPVTLGAAIAAVIDHQQFGQAFDVLVAAAPARRLLGQPAARQSRAARQVQALRLYAPRSRPA